MHIKNCDEVISYAYNGDGQRVLKTVNGITTEYFYNGEILAGQKTGDDVIVFMYDNNGDAFGFIYNETEYYYVKNAQNDIIAIADADGTVIANYYYDAWGKSEGITGNTEIANLNPLRYRSYYYDTESALYYFNTRYYSADICRFINGDSIIDNRGTTTLNLFLYCVNNPIINYDSDGNLFTSIIVAGLIVAGLALILSGCFSSNSTYSRSSSSSPSLPTQPHPTSKPSTTSGGTKSSSNNILVKYIHMRLPFMLRLVVKIDKLSAQLHMLLIIG